jgi:hypothetical protein
VRLARHLLSQHGLKIYWVAFGVFPFAWSSPLIFELSHGLILEDIDRKIRRFVDFKAITRK